MPQEKTASYNKTHYNLNKALDVMIQSENK